MMNEPHYDVIDRLSDYLDGALDGAAHRELDEHLASCGTCREVLEELRSVVSGAAALGEVSPDRDLWPGIAAAIGAPLKARPLMGSGDVIAFPTARAARRDRRGVFLSVPQLAAASLALAVATAAVTWSVSPTPTAPTGLEAGASAGAGSSLAVSYEVTGAPPELAAELAALEEALEQVRGRLDPNTVRIVEKNLGVIERAIVESLLALEQDPANEFVRAHLERAYREKADYLRDAARLAEWES